MITAPVYLVTFYIDGRRFSRETVPQRDIAGKEQELAELGRKVGAGDGLWLAVYEDASEAQLPYFTGNDEELGQTIARAMGAKLPIRPTISQQVVQRHPDL